MVSIILTTYNRRKLIDKSLRSILNQTYSEFELIIVDDASTDGTYEYISSAYKDERIKLILLDRNSGSTVARNRGLDSMHGDYFLVWDSDDILYPNALEVLVGIFAKHPNLAVVSAPARSLLGDKEIAYLKLDEGILERDLLFSRSLPSNHKVRLARRSLCGDIRYKSKNIDFLVNVEMAEKGDWYCYASYLGDVILESDNNSLTIRRRKTNLTLAKERTPFLVEYLSKHGDVVRKWNSERYSGFAYGASIGFLANGEVTQARQFASLALKNKKRLKYLFFFLLTCIPFSPPLFILAVKLKNAYFSTISSIAMNFARKRM